jgi:hypothetical protein
MQLLQLTPAEAAFLSMHFAEPDGLQARLTRKLAATLTARLRLPVRVKADVVSTKGGDAPSAPVWQPDAALVNVWLTRRLGGHQVMGASPFIPQGLLRTLDVLLAECWLDRLDVGEYPASLAWHLATDLTQATLAVQLPHPTIDMTRWARGVIRHG